jgi:putative ABC transport system permease protein
LNAVRAIDVGYDADRIAYGWVEFRDPVGHYVDYYTGSHADQVATGLPEIAQRLERSPNVEGVALSSIAPMAGYAMTRLFTPDRQPISPIANRDPVLLGVSPEYFRVTGVHLVRGRLFTDADVSSGESVIVVNETAARTYWPGRDPIGQCLVVSKATAPCSTVIGVTRDAHISDIVEAPLVSLFQPIGKGAYHGKPSVIVVRARSGGTEAALRELRDELARTFPSAEPPEVRSVAGAREPELRAWRLGATLFSAFGVLALVVATIGVYSVMAFSVSQRTHEMGLRIALGAREGQVARLIVGQGVWPIAVGVVIGVALSLAFGRFVAEMLYDTKPGDPLVVASVCALLIGAGASGALVPAWRATRVNPVVALRAD